MKFVNIFKRNEEVDVEEYIGMVVGDKVKDFIISRKGGNFA